MAITFIQVKTNWLYAHTVAPLLPELQPASCFLSAIIGQTD